MLSKLLTLLALAALPALAQYEVKDGYCEQGGQQVVGPGNQLSTTRVQRSYPSCTVQVTLSAGGAATIFSDSTGTPLANPFTAATNGYYFFFIAPNTHFNVTISGGGLAAPITHSYYVVGSTGGGGTLTSINSQAGPAVTIAAGSAGTDFGITQAGNTITLNLPSASATNRGALLAADWSTFNAKESALTFSSPLSRVINTISLTTVGIGTGGTGQTTKLAAFNALSPLTTKGDVIGFDGSNNVRLGVGANNSCLIADSSQATGLRYDATCHMAIGGTITSSTSGSLLYVSAGLLAQSLVSGGGNQCIHVNNAGVPTGTGTDCAGAAADIVKNDQSNTYTTGNQDFRNATAFELPVSAGGTTTTNGGALYDSTGNQVHFAVNLTDRIMVYRADSSIPTPGNCVQWGAAGIVSDTGSACGSGGSGITTLTGDVTAGPGSGSQAATVVNLPSGVTMAAFLRATAIAAPGTPSAGVGAIYVDSSSKNLAVKDDAGVVKHGVQTDTGTANNYISAISDSGAITKSRPACATLSDSGTGCSAAAGITQLTGDVTAGAGSGSQAATVVNLPTGVTQAGYLAATAIVAPATPGAGVGRIYVDSTSKNLSVKDDAGIVKHGVQTQATVAGNFVTAISDAGGVTVSGAVPCTATPITCTIYDSTATTGSTLLEIKAGAAQSSGGTMLNIRNSSNQIVGFVDSLGAIYTQEGSTGRYKQALTAANGSNGNSLNMSSDSCVDFNSTNDIHTGADDAGLCRGGVGQVNVCNGTNNCASLAALAASLVKTGSSAPTCTSGTGGSICLHEGTAVTGEANADNCYGDSTVHNILCSPNNGPFIPIIATTTVTTGTSATLVSSFTVNQEATAATGVTYTLPTAAAGLQYCIDNGYNGTAADTGVLTFATSAAGQFMVFTDGTLTATGGNVTSGGAARDGACVYGIDSTHWMFLPHSGTWTKH